MTVLEASAAAKAAEAARQRARDLLAAALEKELDR